MSSSDCPCKAIPAVGDPKGHVTASAGVSGAGDAPLNFVPGVGKAPRQRAPKVYKGRFCVVSAKTGKTFNCFHAEETAEKMASRLGSKFKVRKK